MGRPAIRKQHSVRCIRRVVSPLLGFFYGDDISPPTPAGFPIDINFIDQPSGAPPTNGVLLTGMGTPGVTLSVTDFQNGTLSGAENRTLYQTSEDPAQAIGFDLHAFTGGISIPATGARIQFYVATTANGERVNVSCAWGNGPDLHWSQDASTDDGLFCRIQMSSVDVDEQSVYTIIDNAYAGPGVSSITYAQQQYWTRYRVEFDGTARTILPSWKDMGTLAVETGNLAVIPAEGTFPYPDFRYFCIWPYIGNGYSNFKLHSIWIGEIDDDWPADRVRS